jgi:uncharacterized DUF497 family protein
LHINEPLDWSQRVVDKIWDKHNVNPQEVEEAVFGDEDATSHKSSNESYCLYAQSVPGRHLLIVVKAIDNKNHYKVITARDMQEKEKRYYKKKK